MKSLVIIRQCQVSDLTKSSLACTHFNVFVRVNVNVTTANAQCVIRGMIGPVSATCWPHVSTQTCPTRYKEEREGIIFCLFFQ